MGSRDTLGRVEKPVDASSGASRSGSAERAHDAIRESEARLRSVLESAPNMIMTADPEGTILFINRVSPPNSSPAEVIGTSLYKYVPDPDVERVRACIQHVLRTGEVSSYEIRAPLAYGARAFSVHVGPVRNGESVAGVTLITWDITERVALQARLMATDRLASAGSLAAGVAHEVNNPLAHALLNLEWIAAKLANEERPDLPAVRARVGFAVEALERIRDIVRDLSSVARDDEGDKIGVDVKDVLESSLRIAHHHIEPRARVVRDYRDIPQVRVRVSRLGQIFVNILVNAAQAIGEGRPEENQIRVSTSTDDTGAAIVEIADTGSGIPPERVEHIFEPFVTTKTDGVGSGLGLFVCNRLISSMGGTLRVVRSGASGTTMRVCLPAAGK
jgi:PAS domain S-box-containing protein